MQPRSKILVRTPNWIGDHVMAIPFYAALREDYPSSEITFVSPESLKDFEDEKWRDRKIILTEKERHLSKAFVQKALSLRNEKYELALSLPASFSTAFFLFLARAKNRVGFSSGGNEIFLQSSLPWKKNQSGLHKSELYLSLIEYLSAHKPHKTNGWQGIASQKENSIVVAPGASLPLREYPHFSELLLSLSNAYPTYKLVIVGGKREEKYKTQLKRLNLPNVVDQIGKTSLKEVVELCRKAKVVISNDSGIAHLSATLARTSTLVLMGPGDPDYILPIGGKARALRVENLPCSPCEKSYCRAAYGYQACLKSLGPESVIQGMKSLTL